VGPERRDCLEPAALTGEKGSFRFGRDERLKKGSEIRKVFSKGKSVGCRGAKLFALENGLGGNRICFTFPRGFSGAAKRNRARRLGREAYRALKPGLCRGYDLVLLVYPEDEAAGLADRAAQLRRLLAKAGLAGAGLPKAAAAAAGAAKAGAAGGSGLEKAGAAAGGAGSAEGGRGKGGLR